MSLDFHVQLHEARRLAALQRSGVSEEQSKITDYENIKRNQREKRNEGTTLNVPSSFYEDPDAEKLLPPTTNFDLTSLNSYRIGDTPTIRYIPEFISDEEEEYLLSQINNKDVSEVWTYLTGRKLQNWGGKPRKEGLIEEPLPAWAKALSHRLVAAGVFEKLPNHALINSYGPGNGIMPHKDGPIYFPRVSILSLGGSVKFHFQKELKGDPKEEILVARRSLLLFENEAYTDLYHSIPFATEDEISQKTLGDSDLERGSMLKRVSRISVTMRVVPPVKI